MYRKAFFADLLCLCSTCHRKFNLHNATLASATDHTSLCGTKRCSYTLVLKVYLPLPYIVLLEKIAYVLLVLLSLSGR